MTKISDPDKSRLAEVLGNHFGSIVLAFAASFAASWLLAKLGLPAEKALIVDMIVFFTVVYADPVSAIRKKKPRRDVLAKLAVGLGIAALVAVPLGLSFEGSSAEGPVEAVADDTPLSKLPWHLFLIMLIMPLMFFGPLAEKVLKRQKDETPVTSDDVQISATFPIFVTITMALNLAVPGALWALGAPLSVAAILMVTSILICATETWMAEPDELIPDVDNTEWGPRAKSAAEAWSGLRKGLQQSFASALFIGSMIYISIQLAVPYFPSVEAMDGLPLSFLIDFLLASGIVLVSSLVLIAAGCLTLAIVAYVLSRSKGADPLTIVEFIKQSQARLLGGGMHWVRPDLEND